MDEQIKTTRISTNVLVKIFFIFVIIILLVSATYLVTKENFKNKLLAKPIEEVLLTTGYRIVLWQDFGQVFEPIIQLPIYFPQKGFQEEAFLLDSGAVVSSLPREKAAELGFSLSQLPRSTFAGFGGTTAFAYRANLKVKLGNQETKIPVVFTEAAGTKPILGRSGFFEDYSVYFDAKDQKVEIRR